jgi:hypothetical protein
MIQIERTIVIVDLENACGGAHMVPTLHKPVHQAVNCLVGVDPRLIIYSTGPKAIGLCPDMWFEWHDARFVLGHGLNGADNALIEVIRHEPAASRSTRLVLVSGDHAFAEPVAELKAQGIRTTVVSRPGSLSKELAQHADQICWLPEFSLTPNPPTSSHNYEEAA